MHELEQLDGELDVAQPAAAELELAVGVVRAHVLLDAAAHGLHVRDEVGPARGRPHHRRDGLGVGLAQVGVARDRARLEQRLELPGLGPPLVVGHVSVERADQRALPALGTQVRVDREARLPRDAHHPGGQLGGPLVRGFGDEHDVDVADVVQLRATRLAHGDDSEPARLAVGLRERDGERRPQGRGGQVGELRGDVLERQDRQRRLADGGEVGGGEGEHLVAVGGAQGVHGVAVAQRRGGGALGTRRRAVGVRADGRQQRRGAGGDVGARVGGGRGQPAPAVGLGDEVVAERGRATEQGEQPPAEHDVIAQRGLAGRPLARVRAREPVQCPQREVRVGAAGQGPHDVLDAPRGLVVRPPPQCPQRLLGPRAGQPEPGERVGAPARRQPSGRRPSSGHPGHRRHVALARHHTAILPNPRCPPRCLGLPGPCRAGSSDRQLILGGRVVRGLRAVPLPSTAGLTWRSQPSTMGGAS